MSDDGQSEEPIRFRSQEEQRTESVLEALADAVAIAHEERAQGVHVVLELPGHDWTRIENTEDITFMIGALQVSVARLSEVALDGAEPCAVPTVPPEPDGDEGE